MKNGKSTAVVRRPGNNRRAVVVSNTSSMLPTKGAGRVTAQTTTRHYLANSKAFVSETVLSTTQSIYGLGSQFTAGTLIFSAEQLSAAAKVFIQSFDKYQISNIEIFVTYTIKSLTGRVERNAPVNLWFYEDTDCDASSATSWLRVRDRRNLGMVTLNSLTPMKRLLSFKPTPSYDTSTVVSQSPANIVPKKGQWLDALNLSQQMAGFRFFGASPAQDSSAQSYEFKLDFSTRYTVSMQQPI